jgi:hypothetical protein
MEKYNQYNLVFKHKHLDNKKLLILKNTDIENFILNYKEYQLF